MEQIVCFFVSIFMFSSLFATSAEALAEKQKSRIIKQNINSAGRDILNYIKNENSQTIISKKKNSVILPNLKYNKRLISTELSTKIVKINRTIVTILLATFIYINYKTKELDLRKGIDTKPDDLQILASYISLIAGLIVLYTVFRFGENAIVNTENPDV